jgi:hypothetical protein
VELFQARSRFDEATRQLHKEMKHLIDTGRAVLPQCLDLVRDICVDPDRNVLIRSVKQWSPCAAHVDHIIAKAKGGTNSIENKQLLHFHLNISKYIDTLEVAQKRIMEESGGQPYGLTVEQLKDFAIQVTMLGSIEKIEDYWNLLLQPLSELQRVKPQIRHGAVSKRFQRLIAAIQKEQCFSRGPIVGFWQPSQDELLGESEDDVDS